MCNHLMYICYKTICTLYVCSYNYEKSWNFTTKKLIDMKYDQKTQTYVMCRRLELEDWRKASTVKLFSIENETKIDGEGNISAKTCLGY